MSYIEAIRSRVGKRKIFLAYASVVLRSQEGGVLLQRRTDFDAWGLPGGILELGESLRDCAHRELHEETGLTSGKLSLVGVYSDPQWEVEYPNGDQVQQFTVCFQGRVAGGEMRPDGVETSDQRFFDPGEIPFEELADFYRAMLRDALSGGPPAFSPPIARPETLSQIGLMRQLAPGEPFIGVAALAVIRDHAGRILMVRRANGGEWDFPGGYLNLGENAAHAAWRETLEATGLEIEPEALLGVHSPVHPWPYPAGSQIQRVTAIFRARITGGRLQANSEEIQEAAWRKPEEILHQDGEPALVELKRGVINSLPGEQSSFQ